MKRLRVLCQDLSKVLLDIIFVLDACILWLFDSHWPKDETRIEYTYLIRTILSKSPQEESFNPCIGIIPEKNYLNLIYIARLISINIADICWHLG